jgi:LmbE family N-acetylglucosaminyl deacetylase/CheY-like chemotaxis protein
MDQYRVLVVEDDLDVGMYTRTVLEKRIGCEVVLISNPADVPAAVASFRPDVVITDIEMPGKSGLDLIVEIREVQPNTPVIVMTAFASVDYAVGALRRGANEFLVKPVSSVDLVNNVVALATEFRTPRSLAKKHVVLAIGAHPDDVEAGAGGVLAVHTSLGDEVTILTLSRGHRDGGNRVAWEEGSRSASVIGAKLIFEDDIDSNDAMLTAIKRVVDEISPTVVYVHSKNDRRQDHRAVHEAAIAATEEVHTVACFQGNTGTVEFTPNRFLTIDGFTDEKLAMVASFAGSEERPSYLEPDFVLASARYWSQFGQGTYCEPFEIVRETGLSPAAWMLGAEPV